MKNVTKTRDGARVEWRNLWAVLRLGEDGWHWADQWNVDSAGPFATAAAAERDFRRHTERCRSYQYLNGGLRDPNRGPE